MNSRKWSLEEVDGALRAGDPIPDLEGLPLGELRADDTPLALVAVDDFLSHPVAQFLRELYRDRIKNGPPARRNVGGTPGG